MLRVAANLGRLIDRIKVNASSKEMHEGRSVWVKKRRASAEPILASANAFFRAANAPLRAIADCTAWQLWEVESFHLLHGDQFHAAAPAERTVIVDAVPGISLTEPLDCGELTPVMTAAAGRELYRAHQLSSLGLAGLWSHGDPHLGNFIYEPAQDRARLIDFEVIHHRSMPALDRHADDVLVFLQDMAGRIEPKLWPDCAQAFLKGYGAPTILDRLPNLLRVPRGFARIWWMVRTGYLAPAEWDLRINALQNPPQTGGA